MKNIEKEARKLRKALHGQINFETLTKHMESTGFAVVLFNDTNKLIKRYSLEETAKAKSAFTYVDKTSSLIFIRENLHANDKLLQLLHEIGHITLGHLKGNYLRVTEIAETEYQANHFAHLVLRPKALPAFMFPLGICVLSALLFVSFSYNIILSNKQNAIQTENYSISTEVYSKTNTEYVYITQTGSKYHTQECNYASNSIRLELEEAKKLYTPCKHCNP